MHWHVYSSIFSKLLSHSFEKMSCCRFLPFISVDRTSSTSSGRFLSMRRSSVDVHISNSLSESACKQTNEQALTLSLQRSAAICELELEWVGLGSSLGPHYTSPKPVEVQARFASQPAGLIANFQKPEGLKAKILESPSPPRAWNQNPKNMIPFQVYSE